MLTAREQIQCELDELIPDYVGLDYLREAETMLETLNHEFGEHPLVTSAIKKISERIISLEIGES